MSEYKLKQIFVHGAIPPEKISKDIAKHATKLDIGGHSIFLGQVRNDKVNGRDVMAIDYTCYEDLALQKMHELREALFDKYELTCMHVYHSLGRVKAGEICLFVFTSSKHRKPAMDACEELVDRIKKELPIWGKEMFDEEEGQWKVNKES